MDLEQKHFIYNEARAALLDDPEALIEVENLATEMVKSALIRSIPSIIRDYNEASELYAFWMNYPPEDRGRSPRGDQYPWIEVGEHAIGVKLARDISTFGEVLDTGFPTGPDQRFLIHSEAVHRATRTAADAVWLAVDIKAAGPRDDFAHAVMSPNQISGLGEWPSPEDGVKNPSVWATGSRSRHAYQPMLPPLIVLSDGTVAPTVTMAVKPIYEMPVAVDTHWPGQRLARIDLYCIPNGLLLCGNPNYLSSRPGLLFPGKDDAGVPLRRKRARVSRDQLAEIHDWRVQTVFP